MVIKINKKECIGCALCEGICPEIFEMGEDMKSHVKSQKESECLDEAIESCPVGAITK